MERYRGKVALVTGASSGIGAATAKILCLNFGLKVVGCARRLDRLQRLEKEINTSSTLFYPYKCDMVQDKEIKDMFDWIKQHKDLGSLEVTVCNAGMAVYKSLLEASPQDLQLMSNVNVISASYCAQLSVDLMTKNDSGGSGTIIFVGSVLGHMITEDVISYFYTVTKHALSCLAETWRQQVVVQGNNKIRVASINPGLVETEVILAAVPDDPEFSKFIFETIPNLKDTDIVDMIVNILAPDQNVQMQDLTVSHVQYKKLALNLDEDTKL